VGAAGSVTTGGVGGFNPGTSGAYEIKVTDLGWLADLASHFALWKLHRLTLVFTPTRQVVTTFADLTAGSTVGTGIVCVGISDDVDAYTAATPAVIQELRSSGEFALGHPWSLSYRPTGRASEWLYTSKESGSDKRLVAAGVLVMASSAVTAANLTVGRLELIVEVSMKGAVPFRTPLLCAPTPISSAEEQKSSQLVKSAAKVAGDQASSEQEYELVPVPIRRVPQLKSQLGLH